MMDFDKNADAVIDNMVTALETVIDAYEEEGIPKEISFVAVIGLLIRCGKTLDIPLEKMKTALETAEPFIAGDT